MASKIRHQDLTTPFKSLVPPLSPEERQQLESNILRDGCRDPLAIWKDHDALLDGHNRLEICLEHDLAWDEVEIELEDQDAAEDWIDANQLGRRNLAPDQFNFMMGRRYNRAKKRHGAEPGGRGNQHEVVSAQNEQLPPAEFVLSSDQPYAELSQPTNQSDPGGDTADRMAKDYSVSRATVVRAGQFVDATDKLKSIDPNLEAKIVRGQAPPRAAVIKAAQILEKSPEKAKAILSGKSKTSEVVREIRREEQDIARSVAIESMSVAARDELSSVCDIRHCSMAELLRQIEPDCIITDPPYPEEFVPLYGQLAELSVRVPVVAVMCGQTHFPSVIDAMCRHLKYRWTMAYLTPGGQAVQQFQSKVNAFWKPILLFGEAVDWLGDVCSSDANDNDKEHHEWGQSESGMSNLIERLSKPGQLICDPFVGGGTTAVVSLKLGRRFVGCDIDENCVKRSIERCKEIYATRS